ncbi:MAG: molybdate ABC transporter permease subunit, partial [Rubricella sp.]
MNGWIPGSEEWGVIGLSLRVAFWATALSLPLGIWIAHVLARRDFAGKWLLDGIVHLPLVLPPVVTGYALLLLFGPQGPVGTVLNSIGMRLAFAWEGAVLAAAVMAFPLMVRAIRISIEAVDRGLEDAAATLGASPFTVFRRVTLPLALPGVLAGAVLAFAKALGEFGATITFVGNIPGETQVIAIALFEHVEAL